MVDRVALPMETADSYHAAAICASHGMQNKSFHLAAPTYPLTKFSIGELGISVQRKRSALQRFPSCGSVARTTTKVVYSERKARSSVTIPKVSRHY